MILTILMFSVALCLSAVAAFYSIAGLAAIFAAATLPIILMGSILEIAKLVVTVWLHEYWHQCKRTMKAYLVPAVGILMLITSMGIFGFLSKAHLDQAVPTGDVAAQVSLLDEKIKTEKDNIESARRALTQMDSAVDQTMVRSTDEKGADKAANLRRSQAKERGNLQNDIAQAQKKIATLNEQRAPIASQLRKVEAEVGPIKYIAALLYGDNPDANILEKAVRVVIIILVMVFDPLAVMMLLAATESWTWHKQQKTKKEPDYEPDDGALTDDQINQLNALADEYKTVPESSVIEDIVEEDTTEELPFRNKGTQPSIPMTASYVQPNVVEEPEVEDSTSEPATNNVQVDDDDDSDSAVVRQAKYLWKLDNPNKTLKEERRLVFEGKLKSHGWEDYLNDPRIVTDVDFGKKFPPNPTKGDMFVNIDQLPTQLFKYNGEKWIEVDKNLSEHFAYNQAYINHLISKISSGEYDPELLTNNERSQIESQLRREV